MADYQLLLVARLSGDGGSRLLIETIPLSRYLARCDFFLKQIGLGKRTHVEILMLSSR